MGDRNYLSPFLEEELEQNSIELPAPFPSATHDPWPKRSPFLSRVRYRIDTTFSQLVDHYQVKRVWVKDTWHLHSRRLRKVLSHTMALFLNQIQRDPPMQLGKVLS